jgi:hypothetical protein
VDWLHVGGEHLTIQRKSGSIMGVGAQVSAHVAAMGAVTDWDGGVLGGLFWMSPPQRVQWGGLEG